MSRPAILAKYNPRTKMLESLKRFANTDAFALFGFIAFNQTVVSPNGSWIAFFIPDLSSSQVGGASYGDLYVIELSRPDKVYAIGRCGRDKAAACAGFAWLLNKQLIWSDGGGIWVGGADVAPRRVIGPDLNGYEAESNSTRTLGSISPNGRFVFVTYRRNGWLARLILDVKTGNMKILTAHADEVFDGMDVRWLPDGRLLGLKSFGRGDYDPDNIVLYVLIWRVVAGKTLETKLERNIALPIGVRNVIGSPRLIDANCLAVVVVNANRDNTRERGLYVVQLDTGSVEKKTDVPIVHIRQITYGAMDVATWVPDGSGVLMGAINPSAQGNYGTYFVPFAGSPMHNLHNILGFPIVWLE